MSVTMQDIAMLAGVSRPVVSAVLNGSKGTVRVSEVKLKLILKIARDLNYVPNNAARSLSGGRTNTVGVFGGVFSDYGVRSALVMEIMSQLKTRGYRAVGGNAGHGDAGDVQRFLAEFCSHGVDGVIVFEDASMPHEQVVQALSVPHVLHTAGQTPGDVQQDMAQTGYLGAHHLVEHGHRHVAYVQVSRSQAEVRVPGWHRALVEAGVDNPGQFRLSLRDLDGSADALLAEFRRLEITAAFCSNDHVAGKLMAALIQRGVRVPDEIAIVGADGHSFGEFCPVPLTHVVHPVRKEAEALVDLLLERIDSNEVHAPPVGIRIAPWLYRGGSCGCPVRKIDRLYRINTPSTLEHDYLLNFGIDIREQETGE